MSSIFRLLQKSLALVAMAFAVGLTAMADNTLTFNNLTVDAGGTVMLNVNMDNSVSICGVQFDLYLPAGVTLAKDVYGDDDINIVGRTTLKRHTIGYAVQEDGALRVAVASTQNAEFSGTTGDIVALGLRVDAGLAAGDYPIVMRKIELTTPDEVPYRTEQLQHTLTVKGGQPAIDPNYDVNKDGKVTIADVNDLINYLLRHK